MIFISKTERTVVIRWIARIITIFCACLLLVGIPASAARMGSVDINGSEVAYQAQYDAYTQAASEGDAIVCEFTVSNPTAGKNGALCRIVMSQGQNLYLYMDAGDLAVMRYDGSEYKKFGVDYQLQSNVTYTLCVFVDGLVLFDGTRCYTYSGNLYGFTDVIAGWSDDSNVFSTRLTKQESTQNTQTESNPETTTENNTAAAETTSMEAVSNSVSNAYPSLWVVLAILLGVTSNLMALMALRSSNIVLRTVQKSMPHSRTSRSQSPPPSKQAKSMPKRPPAKPKAPPTASARRQPPTARPTKPTPQASATQPPEKKQQRFFDVDQLPPSSPASVPAHATSPQPTQPFDVYNGDYWRTNQSAFLPCNFGSSGFGYCIFSRGANISSDMFVLMEDEYIWLNPVRFHATSPEHGVFLRMGEIAGIAMAFNFCHVDTGKREIALACDAEMVNFRPARVKETPHGTWELIERGVIVFEPA
ncbi:MAG: hypothetical protein Q4D42_06215 [Eubacteriales bacterium]|nr:hypothetical protein [Eubacteriales bacterium]